MPGKPTSVRCDVGGCVGRILTIETLPLKLARKLWAGPDHLNPDQTYFPDEYLHHVLYITRIYFIYGTTHSELIGLFLLLAYLLFSFFFFLLSSFFIILQFYPNRLPCYESNVYHSVSYIVAQ